MKYILIILVVSLAIVSNAQDADNTPSEYNNVIGGSIFLNSSSNNSRPNLLPGQIIFSTGVTTAATNTETKNKGFNIATYYGRRLNQSWMLGTIGAYTRSKYSVLGMLDYDSGPIGTPVSPRIEPISESKTKELSLDLFARYYFGTESKFQFFVEPRLGINHYRNDRLNVTVIDSQRRELDAYVDRSVIKAQVIPGINYNINKRLNLLMSAGVLSYQYGQEETRYESYIRTIDVIILPGPVQTGVINTIAEKDVRDLTLSLRTTSIYFSLEFKF